MGGQWWELGWLQRSKSSLSPMSPKGQESSAGKCLPCPLIDGVSPSQGLLFSLRRDFFWICLGKNHWGLSCICDSPLGQPCPVPFSVVLKVFYSWSALSCDQTQEEGLRHQNIPSYCQDFLKGLSPTSIFQPIDNHCYWEREQGSSSWKKQAKFPWTAQQQQPSSQDTSLVVKTVRHGMMHIKQ